MAQDPNEDDLDNILSSALEAFDSPAPSGQASTAEADNGKPNEAPAEEEALPAVSEEATKYFEDALKSLGQLDMGDENLGDLDDVTEADLKMVEEFMKSLGDSLGGLSGNDPASASAAPNVDKLVENIVGQLLSEDVLKEPMLQMKDAYKQWLPENKEKLSKENYEKYQTQENLVNEICDKYESGASTEDIMQLLTKMQETGAPPDDVMNKLSAGNRGAADLEKVTEACGVQ